MIDLSSIYILVVFKNVHLFIFDYLHLPISDYLVYLYLSFIIGEFIFLVLISKMF